MKNLLPLKYILEENANEIFCKTHKNLQLMNQMRATTLKRKKMKSPHEAQSRYELFTIRYLLNEFLKVTDWN